MLIDVHAIVNRVVAAGQIIPGQRGGRGCTAVPKPDVESIEEDAIRIVRVYGQALVVPILRVIAIPAFAVSEQIAARADDLRPGGASVRAPKGAELAAIGIAAAGIRVGRDRLDLRVDVVRIARGDRKVDAAELIPGAGADI